MRACSPDALASGPGFALATVTDSDAEELHNALAEICAALEAVEAGTTSDGMLLIQSGLAPGDRVIDRGAARVVDGERVALIES